LQASNILFVDQPTGTGFSYTSDDSDIRHDETGVSNDLYNFLQVKILIYSSFFIPFINLAAVLYGLVTFDLYNNINF